MKSDTGMSDKLHTCGKCEHLMFAHTQLITSPYCGMTNNQLIVPHFFDGNTEEVTLTRVPEFCENDEAKKSSKPAAKKHHLTVKIKEISSEKINQLD